MNIRIGNYHLANDSRQYTLSEVRVSEGEKTAGEEILTDTTYHPSIDSALKALLERKIKESDAMTLAELRRDFNAAVAWIQSQFYVGKVV